MEKYVIDYNTGIKDELEFYGLQDVKEYAENQAEYTQQDIDIYHDGKLVACLRWYGYPAGQDNIDDCQDGVDVNFGDFGFYSWEE